MESLDFETERNEAAWVAFLALLASGVSNDNSYETLAGSAYIAADAFKKVKEEQNKDGV